MNTAKLKFARRRQIELTLLIKALEKKGITQSIAALKRKLRPKIRILEKEIRKFHVTYVWDLSYYSLKNLGWECRLSEDRPWTRWNKMGITPQPSRQEIDDHALNERELYIYNQKLRNIQTEYNDAITELKYWVKRFGPLKSTPRFNHNPHRR
jgi:hypothetical protein